MSRARELVSMKGKWSSSDCMDAASELARLDSEVEHWREVARAEADARTQDQALISSLTAERDALKKRFGA